MCFSHSTQFLTHNPCQERENAGTSLHRYYLNFVSNFSLGKILIFKPFVDLAVRLGRMPHRPKS